MIHLLRVSRPTEDSAVADVAANGGRAVFAWPLLGGGVPGQQQQQ